MPVARTRHTQILEQVARYFVDRSMTWLRYQGSVKCPRSSKCSPEGDQIEMFGSVKGPNMTPI